jgi:hypothetical protein
LKEKEEILKKQIEAEKRKNEEPVQTVLAIRVISGKNLDPVGKDISKIDPYVVITTANSDSTVKTKVRRKKKSKKILRKFSGFESYVEPRLERNFCRFPSQK